MAFTKVGLNLSVFNNLSVPSFQDLNISTNSTEIIEQIPEKANQVTMNYFGLGVMVVLFFYLIYRLRDIVEQGGQAYSTVRSVGISAGVCALMGINLLSIGYFTDYYHVVIFMGILSVCIGWVWYEDYLR